MTTSPAESASVEPCAGSGTLRRSLADALAPIAAALAADGVRPPCAAWLAPHRRAAAESVVVAHLPAARELAPEVACGDARARLLLATLADQALAEMWDGARRRAIA